VNREWVKQQTKNKQTTNNKTQTTNNKQQTTNNKQQTTKHKQQTTNNKHKQQTQTTKHKHFYNLAEAPNDQWLKYSSTSECVEHCHYFLLFLTTKISKHSRHPIVKHGFSVRRA
jgi:hypothetical protein